MSGLYDLVVELTNLESVTQRDELVTQFSKETGWHPSYARAARDSKVTGHLLVEHGLENAAVISFFGSKTTFSDLDLRERADLLSLSYNNLVDWHLAVEKNQVTFLYNRADESPVVRTSSISRSDTDALRVEAFEKIVGLRPSGNVRALDDALILTISEWKRKISMELGRPTINPELSNLFNGLMFARAAEDHTLFLTGQLPAGGSLQENSRSCANIAEAISTTIRAYSSSVQGVKTFINFESLSLFDALDSATVKDLIGDFYINRYAKRYAYDFSVISNHALSRIYERYVSLLTLREEEQLNLFGTRIEDAKQSTPGTVYTPEFIARFFARCVESHYSPSQLKQLGVIDPACGSGIFLRTMLEVQCNPARPGYDAREATQVIASSTWGIDIDESAVNASRLSLALLGLVLTGQVPVLEGIKRANALDTQVEWGGPLGPDVVIMNPPYIRYEDQSETARKSVRDTVGRLEGKKLDTYAAFLYKAVESLAPGGLCCAVVPRSLLVGGTTRGLRRFLAENCIVRSIVDLSRINVFEADAYVVLIVLERKQAMADHVYAQLMKCEGSPGAALQDLIEGRTGNFGNHTIDSVHQSWFGADTWAWVHNDGVALSPSAGIRPLGSLVDVRQGFITGRDSVFLLDSNMVPADSAELFVPYLPDRLMTPYVTPSHTGRVVFLPEHQGKQLSLEEIQSGYPGAYEFLMARRRELESRYTSLSRREDWWKPIRGRGKSKLLVPKIVTPHLMFLPKFGLDDRGEYAVSRSPYIAPFDSATDSIELLAFLTAVLNSDQCANWLAANCHSYSRGYAMLEVQQLKRCPVPDPGALDRAIVARIVQIVKEASIKRAQVKSPELEELRELVDKCWGPSASRN